ncbi:hypothetical protein LQZ44_05185 [Alcaligenes nematophilus]|uniref:glycoside hydrolase family protein n=1 Tax=Alcaligenes nematophilus TaxID=2994643 RepID=UPI0035B54D63
MPWWIWPTTLAYLHFKGSTLVRLFNAGDQAGAFEQFLRWNKSGGKVLLGLNLAAWALLQIGWRQGKAQAEQKQTKADMADVEVSRDATETIERLDDDAVRDRTRKRMCGSEGR